MIMKGRVYRACVRMVMICGGYEEEEEGVLQRPERAMVTIVCGVKSTGRMSSGELMTWVGLSTGMWISCQVAKLQLLIAGKRSSKRLLFVLLEL